MISQRLANLIFGTVLLVVAITMGWIAWGFETPALGDATLPTHFFPLVLLGFIAFCTVIYMFEYVVHGQSGEDGGRMLYKGKIQALRSLLTLVAGCLGYIIWQSFGFIVAGIFVTPAIALAMGTRRLSHMGIILAGSGIIYLIFTYALGTQFR